MRSVVLENGRMVRDHCAPKGCEALAARRALLFCWKLTKLSTNPSRSPTCRRYDQSALQASATFWSASVQWLRRCRCCCPCVSVCLSSNLTGGSMLSTQLSGNDLLLRHHWAGWNSVAVTWWSEAEVLMIRQYNHRPRDVKIPSAELRNSRRGWASRSLDGSFNWTPLTHLTEPKPDILPGIRTTIHYGQPFHCFWSHRQTGRIGDKVHTCGPYTQDTLQDQRRHQGCQQASRASIAGARCRGGFGMIARRCRSFPY